MSTNPKANYHTHKERIDRAVQKVLSTGMYLGGQQTELFEKRWAEYIGVEHCVSVANGTDALVLAMKACRVGPGDYVVVPSFCVSAIAAAVCMTGASPLFVDIDPFSMEINPSELDKVIKDGYNIPAIVLVHLFGRPCDMDAINEVIKGRMIYLIEDCAHAHGAMYKGKKVGSLGDIGCWSFYPTKNLGALGDAGAITTDNEELADKVRQLREYGWGERYNSEIPGGVNSRMDEMQAAVLLEKLPYLDEENDRRREIASKYEDFFGQAYGQQSTLELVAAPSNPIYHVFHKYTIQYPRRNELKDYLSFYGIETEIYYRTPLHRQKAFFTYPSFSMMNTEAVSKTVLSLPLWPELADDYAIKVCKKIAEFLSV